MNNDDDLQSVMDGLQKQATEYRNLYLDQCKVSAHLRSEGSALRSEVEALSKRNEEKELKITALRSEIDAMRAGAEGYRKRMGEMEEMIAGLRADRDALTSERAYSGWDPSRPRYVSGLLPCQPGSVEFVPFAKKGVDNRPTMQELRDIIQDYAPKDYVYCVLKMLSRCGLVKP